MKNIKWRPKFDQTLEGSFCDPNPRPIPTVKGYRFASEERVDIRLFQYHDGDWGVQVTVQRDTKAKSLASAKRKATALVKLMTKKP